LVRAFGYQDQGLGFEFQRRLATAWAIQKFRAA